MLAYTTVDVARMVEHVDVPADVEHQMELLARDFTASQGYVVPTDGETTTCW